MAHSDDVGLAPGISGTETRRARTDGLRTLRWRGVDSKIQFRDASPPAKQRGHIYFGGEWRLFGPPKQLYRFAEADDHSDDSAAPTVDRPQPDRSLETARDGEGEEG